jgi:hypothetical protein
MVEGRRIPHAKRRRARPDGADSDGIPSVLAADDAGGAYPFDLTGGARLLVDAADAEAAVAVLAD